MSVKVSQMTDTELRQFIGDVIEEKLLILLGDSEEDLQINENLRERLVAQLAKVEDGDRGTSFSDLISELELG